MERVIKNQDLEPLLAAAGAKSRSRHGRRAKAFARRAAGIHLRPRPSWRRATQISRQGALSNLARHELKLFGEAAGSGQAPYRVSLTFGDNGGDLKARCSCMAARSRPFCKHAAALLVAWARAPESFVVSEAPPVERRTGARKKSRQEGQGLGHAI